MIFGICALMSKMIYFYLTNKTKILKKIVMKMYLMGRQTFE